MEIQDDNFNPKIIQRLFVLENPQEVNIDKSSHRASRHITDGRCHKKGKVIYEKKLSF
jgi:hypothetical protein